MSTILQRSFQESYQQGSTHKLLSTVLRKKKNSRSFLKALTSRILKSTFQLDKRNPQRSRSKLPKISTKKLNLVRSKKLMWSSTSKLKSYSARKKKNQIKFSLKLRMSLFKTCEALICHQTKETQRTSCPTISSLNHCCQHPNSMQVIQTPWQWWKTRAIKF